MPSARRGADRVAQHADALDLELDDVARGQLPAEVESAATSRRARAVDVARVDVLGGRDVGDHVAPAPPRLGGPGPPPLLPVHATHHLEVRLGPDLVRGDAAGAEGIAEVLALGRTEPRRHLLGLDVARREVVEDGETEDMVP